MHHFPRQTPSSVGAAAPSSGGVTTPTITSGSTSISATGTQTSGLTTATDVTSGLVSSSTSPASFSQSAHLTTSSSSAETTSTSSPASTSPSSSTVPSTTSYPPTPTSTSASPSIALQTTSSASSSVPSSSTTTDPPTSSSSQQGTPTTITTAYTAYVNGSPVLTTTTYPSTIPELSGPSSSSDRTAIIAGSAAGGTALLILILSLAFCARRQRFKRLDFLDAITLKRKQARSRATLLDGEVLSPGPPLHRYTDYETPWDGNERALITVGSGTPGTPGTPGPTLPSRWSRGTGSAFREDIWPPPNEGTRLMDPFANKDDDVDIDLGLGRIVDDVMGPSPTAAHYSDRSVDSIYRGSMAESEGLLLLHSRTVSNASNAILLEAAGLSGTAGVGSTSTAPVRPSPLAQQGTKPAPVAHQDGDTR